MKKKIKNLTLQEIIEISLRFQGACDSCPLINMAYGSELCSLMYCNKVYEKQKKFEKEIEEEIEVDLDEEKD